MNAKAGYLHMLMANLRLTLQIVPRENMVRKPPLTTSCSMSYLRA